MACAKNFIWGSVRQRVDHGLHAGGALVDAHVPGDHLGLSTFDEQNAFTFVSTPAWMWAWSCLPPFPAALVWSILPKEIRDVV